MQYLQLQTTLLNRPSIMDALITVSRQLQVCVGPKSALDKIIVSEPVTPNAVVPIAVEMQAAVEQPKKANTGDKKAANKAQAKKAKQTKRKEETRDLTQLKGQHTDLDELDGGGVMIEDVTIEIPAWYDFYGFSTNSDPRTMDFTPQGFGGYNSPNPSPIDAALFGGWNPLGQSFD